MIEDSFEIYVLSSGRWSLQGQFSKDQRELAQKKAKEILANSAVDAIKLIHCQAIPDTDDTNDLIIFQKTKNDAILALDRGAQTLRQSGAGRELEKDEPEKTAPLPKTVAAPVGKQGLFGWGGSDKAAAPKLDRRLIFPVKTRTTAIPEDKSEFRPLSESEIEQMNQGLIGGDAQSLVAQATIIIMNFFTDAVGYLHEHNYPRLLGGQFSDFDRFGCYLFLVGACDCLAEKNNVGESIKARIIEKSLALITNEPERSRKFAGEYKNYLMTPRYLGMFKSGSEVLARRFAGYKDMGPYMAMALDRWNAAINSGAAENMIFVMFTDIVGSTNLTQQMGDLAGYDIVKAHNSIVRAALASNGGREVKHTGDGIMAAFSIGANAVRAAMDIQRAVEAHNWATSEENHLNLRIGIDGGTPVVEGDDLFGSTVQLAARLCALAVGGDICVSENVHKACEGQPIILESFGEHMIKGFDNPMPVFKVNVKAEPVGDAPPLDPIVNEILPILG